MVISVECSEKFKLLFCPNYRGKTFVLLPEKYEGSSYSTFKQPRQRGKKASGLPLSLQFLAIFGSGTISLQKVVFSFTAE
jgi:hypothetical protein